MAKDNGPKVEKRKVRVRLLEPLLGTVPKDPELYATYIAAKTEDIEAQKEEVTTVPTAPDESKGWTGFHEDKDGLFVYDYLVRGFLKSAMEVMQATEQLTKIPAYKKWSDHLLFVFPRRIHFGMEKPDGKLERPLRAMTPEGPRVTLTRSDFIREGRELEFEIHVLPNTKKITWEAIEKCLHYGAYVGFGQWRGSGGYGRFEVLSIEDLNDAEPAKA